MTVRESGGMQSLDRAIEVLECLADAGEAMGVSQLAAATGLPLPTIHRLVRSLLSNGYVRQDASRRYALGVRATRLGDVARRNLGLWADPHLVRLVAETSETANMAVLEGESAAYVAQVPSSHSMRMFTEVGRRVMLHCTGVGKVLLAQLDDGEVVRILRRTGLPARTDKTLTTESQLLSGLDAIRRQGYAIDDGEQELGVLCVAVAVEGAPGHVAVSVSGPSVRMTDARIAAEFVPALKAASRDLSAELRSH
ncbi:MAG: IclR family transcriptional regulator [Schumannella sp.]|nr:IclR family transcriptional regulator [Schumannella sp.]